jgi:hypothetical protein
MVTVVDPRVPVTDEHLLELTRTFEESKARAELSQRAADAIVALVKKSQERQPAGFSSTSAVEETAKPVSLGAPPSAESAGHTRRKDGGA